MTEHPSAPAGDIVWMVPAQQEPVTGLFGALGGVALAARELAGSMVTTVGVVVGAVLGPPLGAVLDRVVPAIVEAILDRIDITGLVIERVDLERVVTEALNTLELSDVVVDRVDLARIVNAALDSLDLTGIVVEHVDVDAVVQTADLDRVIDRLPIVEIAQYVIEQVDLPRIIRESTGGVALDAVDSVRLQSYSIDTGMARIVDRFLPRRGRRLDAPGDPNSLQDTVMEGPVPQPTSTDSTEENR